ncbi:alpha/beta hydrolase [Actinoalloteichus hymeniacidonis]|uniref:Alpha/beta hydrolase family protein n=1 Tax=Actinoalloteichus hymeniacidonis TaxID=340345 RepID=A0AAC9HU94_9PSEU|nr:alpha/beta hydrolase [Actinoalloteichus hymeniacidonis]AOS65016.1 alpha/beta hydrolase family protein [Actinoalloteichus hymeniacidonis]MBB5906907.1 pimeloyl-ACP methyl ester carboxylesterase [Actinoalloteichus hymeniacidonis]
MLSRITRSSLAVVAVPLLLVAAGCSQPTEQLELQAAESQSSGPPAELARFYDQTPTFEPCEDYATSAADRETFANPGFECARVEVPLDYEQPDGRTAQIAMLRIPAHGEPIGSLLYNPGGPGSSGMSAAAATLAGPLAESPIGENFDFIGFDPRGVGASTPTLNCFSDEEREAGASISSLQPGVGPWTEDDTQQFLAQCAELSGGEDVLANVGTRDAARDMDIIRHVLGDEKLNYFGQSYGTRLGAIYAETFPQNVRTLLLDAPMDPTTRLADRALVQMVGFQDSFDKMAAFCATDPNCPLGTDPEQALENYQNILQPLADNPVPALDGRELNFIDATQGVLAALYSEEVYPTVIAGIAEIQAGRGDILLTLRDVYHGRGADKQYSNNLEAFSMINCVDEDRRTPEEETELVREIYETAPFQDPGGVLEPTRDSCEQWPVEPTLEIPYVQEIEDLTATLTVAATGDPATPFEGGVVLAESLGGSLLSVDATTHGVVLVGGNACVDEFAADYLVNLTTPAEGAQCAG